MKNRADKSARLRTIALALPVLFLLAEMGYYFWIDLQVNDMEPRLRSAKIQLDKYAEINNKVYSINKERALLGMKSEIIKSLNRYAPYTTIFDTARRCFTDGEPQWKTIRLNRGTEDEKGITYYGMIIPTHLIKSEMMNYVNCIKSSPYIAEVDLVKNEDANAAVFATFKLFLKPTSKITKAQ